VTAVDCAPNFKGAVGHVIRLDTSPFSWDSVAELPNLFRVESRALEHYVTMDSVGSIKLCCSDRRILPPYMDAVQQTLKLADSHGWEQLLLSRRPGEVADLRLFACPSTAPTAPPRLLADVRVLNTQARL
jgi:hypothetical protein